MLTVEHDNVVVVHFIYTSCRIIRFYLCLLQILLMNVIIMIFTTVSGKFKMFAKFFHHEQRAWYDAFS